jgi:hypothetical protein
VDIRPRNAADAQALNQRQGGRLVQAGRVAQRALNPMLEQTNGHIGQKQAGDGFIDAAKLPQPARQHDPECTGQRTGGAHQHGANGIGRWCDHIRQRRARQTAQHHGAFAADDDQPRTSWYGHAQGGEHQRCSALQSVLPAEPVAKRAFEQQQPHLNRIHTREPHEHTKQRQRRRNGGNGQGDVGEGVFHGCLRLSCRT